MIRIVDRNDKYIVQKILSVREEDIVNTARARIIQKFLRYQVVPVDCVGNTAAVEVCDTLVEARALVVENMKAWA